MPRALSPGFTLVEVLVATGILVTVAAGTAQLVAVSLRHDVATRQQLAMSAAAAAKLDEIAGTFAHGEPPIATAGALDRDVTGFTDVVTVSGASFRRRWTLAPLDTYSASALVIVVRVLPIAALAAGDLEMAVIADAGGS
jgi:prepilin-type N-terminal cleavage/methylation domain-containing protein